MDKDSFRVSLYTDVVRERLDLCKRLAIIQLGIIGPIKNIDPFDIAQVDRYLADVVDGLSDILELTDKEKAVLLTSTEQEFRKRCANVTDLAHQLREDSEEDEDSSDKSP